MSAVGQLRHPASRDVDGLASVADMVGMHCARWKYCGRLPLMGLSGPSRAVATQRDKRRSVATGRFAELTAFRAVADGPPV